MKKKSSILRFYSRNPWIGFVASVLGIIAFPLSFYFYYAAKESPDLIYYENPIRTTIVKSLDASRLTANYDGKPITTDVTAVQIVVWNAGRRPIRKQDVLEALTLSTTESTPILEAKILRTTREVTGVSLDTTAQGQGVVKINFEIMEFYDGFVVQLVIAGGQEVKATVAGAIVGQKNLRQFTLGSKKATPARAPSIADNLFLNGIGLFFVIALLIMSITNHLERRKKHRELKELVESGTVNGEAVNNIPLRIEFLEMDLDLKSTDSVFLSFTGWFAKYHFPLSTPVLLVIMALIVYRLANLDYFGPPLSF